MTDEQLANHWTECKEKATKREWSAYGDRRYEAYLAGLRKGRELRDQELKDDVMKQNYSERLLLAEQDRDRYREVLEFYADREEKNFQVIFDDEQGSRAAVYEKYKQWSIGTFRTKARIALKGSQE